MPTQDFSGQRQEILQALDSDGWNEKLENPTETDDGEMTLALYKNKNSQRYIIIYSSIPLFDDYDAYDSEKQEFAGQQDKKTVLEWVQKRLNN